MSDSDHVTSQAIRAELLKDLADNVANLAIEMLEVKPKAAKSIGQEAAILMAQRWGGQTIYIPKDLSGRLFTRDQEIFRNFKGDNHMELAMRYGLSIHSVYRIVNRETEKRRQQQGNLLDL